ncbi:MAG: histidine kinase [Bacteroidia bacterium]|nr:histidine kinase [Bacteroidia bacterium]
MKESSRKYLLGTLMIAGIGFLATGVYCTSCWSEPKHFLTVGIYSAFMWILLWRGNEAVSDRLDQKVTWAQNPARRLIFGLLGHMVYTVVAMFLINYAFYLIYGWNQDILTMEGLMNYSIPAVIITFIIASFATAQTFFLKWRELAIEKERMEKEIINSKYEVLKNQVNPHFLFNSLNVLTSLVYKDADLSAAYIKKLSNVYRYVLDVRDREVVDLKEELAFIDSYTFLLKIRHSDGLHVDNQLGDTNGVKIAPLSLQMLVENAVKHNVVSEHEPLTIDIGREGDFIYVKNNLQRKSNNQSKMLKVGLENITERYRILSDRAVEIEDDGSFFKVKLPVLKMER